MPNVPGWHAGCAPFRPLPRALELDLELELAIRILICFLIRLFPFALLPELYPSSTRALYPSLSYLRLPAPRPPCTDSADLEMTFTDVLIWKRCTLAVVHRWQRLCL